MCHLYGCSHWYRGDNCTFFLNFKTDYNTVQLAFAVWQIHLLMCHNKYLRVKGLTNCINNLK